MRNRSRTQADHRDHKAIMARAFPELYTVPVTAEDLAIAARPIDGMRFALGAVVKHYLSGRAGLVENCTMMDDGRLMYTVAWSYGARTVVAESDLREISNCCSAASRAAEGGQ